VVNKARNRRALRDAKKFTLPVVNEVKAEKILLAKDVNELIQLQLSKQVTSVDIVSVYAQRCHSIGRQLNLVTEEYYMEALIDAAEKDRQLAQAIASKTTDKLGKLHGIPVSIKDHIEESGRISTVGCAHFADHIGEKDAIIVQLIRKEGGIPFVKSNNPQIVFAFETDNEIYGLARNPHNPLRSCAGSSGGEGGLVAARCSPLGFGTDIGGSIRGPAAFNGVFGYRPTPYRTSYKGMIIPVQDYSCPQT
jgi:Asp-tRNA(Asn)/Glu-tRNA(Gln) amidotransferase A subunit family amidase